MRKATISWSYRSGLFPIFEILFNRLDHLVSYPCRLWKSRGKVVLDLLELLSVTVHVAETDTIAPVLVTEISTNGKIEIIAEQ